MKTATDCFDALLNEMLTERECSFVMASHWGSISYNHLSYPTITRNAAAIAICASGQPYMHNGHVRQADECDPNTLVFVTACAVTSAFHHAHDLVQSLCECADKLGITLVTEAACIKALSAYEWKRNDKELRNALIELGFTFEPFSPIGTRKPQN